MRTLKAEAVSLALVIALALPGGAWAQALPNAVIATVDTDRIYRECTACRAAQTQLEGMLTSARARATLLGEPLQAEASSIEQASATLRNQTGEARAAAETALSSRMQQFQQRQTTVQQEINRLEENIKSVQANVLSQINTRLYPIISQTMTARGANLALDTNATLSRSATLDITTDVLSKLNQELPSVSLTPLPAQ